MHAIKHIQTVDFDYPLPDQRIARYPLPQREDSKLLVLNHKGITDAVFRDIGSFLPNDALLLVNDTRVVHARLHFRKPEGAPIELFILDPATENADFQLAFASTSPVEWNCLVGNSKRWKSGQLQLPLGDDSFVLRAIRIRKEKDASVIQFSWDAPLSFAEVIEKAGVMPLPPYLGREAETSDQQRYQTVFATFDGSVAAPTAGLHLTSDLVKQLETSGIDVERLTLHVGAGTFKPLSAKTIGEHAMHAEHFVVSKQSLQRLLAQTGKSVVPVGTTSMRSLESLFWIALKLRKNPNLEHLHIDQWYPYENQEQRDFLGRNAIEFLLDYLDKRHTESLRASTAIMIVPGYHFRIANGLITNFHQPRSTLLLLVAALIGKRWKDIYTHALKKDYRFLSYGDSCLFLPDTALNTV